MFKKGTTKVKPGEVYGRLTVLDSQVYIQRRCGISVLKLQCQCTCGNKTLVLPGALVSGNTKSCGCLHREVASKMFTKHGESNNGACYSPEYEAWCHMISRCTNENNKDFHHYGGRGIIVCPKWLKSYKRFLADMGRRPGKGYSIDRIDTNGNYEPSNCRWVTQKEQCHNTRANLLVTIDGKTRKIFEWSEISGVKGSIIRDRLRRGWDAKKSVFAPPRKNGK